MLPVETAFKTFTDLDGKPLHNGYIYFGEPDQDPITHPVTVYWDAAGTLPVLQPLRTVNGYISNAGTPANVFYNGAYSLLVRDSKGRQVFYAASSDAFSIATLVQDFLSDLQSASGATKIGYKAPVETATHRTVADKERDILSVLDFLTEAERADYRAGTLVLDLTAGYQKALNAASMLGAELWGPDGLAKITDTLTVTGDGIKLRLAHNAGIQHNTPSGTALWFSGQRCAVEGGLARGFIGPATWDGTNTAPTYGVIKFSGNGSSARTRLYNVKKVGLWFKDVVDGTVEGCIIEGNYPSSAWTQVETGHWGVIFDPSTDPSGGNFRLIGNTIKLCVQGCQPGNYGSGGIIRGFVATGNIFEGCWNHGIYSNSTNGAIISGNTFNRCQIPVVISGNKNNVTGNTMYTAVDVPGDERDVVGISVRDGCGNVISDNTIKGVAIPSAAAIINVQDVGHLSELNDNVITGNTIEITAGACVAIRLIGSQNAINRNIVADNTIKCAGQPGEGAIEISGKAGALNLGNKVHDNIITLNAESHGVLLVNLTAAEVYKNTVEFAWDSGAPKNLTTVAVLNTRNCLVEGNTSVVRPTWGANLSIFAYREYAAANDNTIRNNVNQVDTAKGATYYPLQLLGGTNPLVDESGPGVPAYNCRVGSRWFRTDGGVGSTFYVRANPADPALWTAVA